MFLGNGVKQEKPQSIQCIKLGIPLQELCQYHFDNCRIHLEIVLGPAVSDTIAATTSPYTTTDYTTR